MLAMDHVIRKYLLWTLEDEWKEIRTLTDNAKNWLSILYVAYLYLSYIIYSTYLELKCNVSLDIQ